MDLMGFMEGMASEECGNENVIIVLSGEGIKFVKYVV